MRFGVTRWSLYVYVVAAKLSDRIFNPRATNNKPLADLFTTLSETAQRLDRGQKTPVHVPALRAAADAHVPNVNEWTIAPLPSSPVEKKIASLIDQGLGPRARADATFREMLPLRSNGGDRAKYLRTLVSISDELSVQPAIVEALAGMQYLSVLADHFVEASGSVKRAGARISPEFWQELLSPKNGLVSEIYRFTVAKSTLDRRLTDARIPRHARAVLEKTASLPANADQRLREVLAFVAREDWESADRAVRGLSATPASTQKGPSRQKSRPTIPASRLSPSSSLQSSQPLDPMRARRNLVATEQLQRCNAYFTRTTAKLVVMNRPASSETAAKRAILTIEAVTYDLENRFVAESGKLVTYAVRRETSTVTADEFLDSLGSRTWLAASHSSNKPITVKSNKPLDPALVARREELATTVLPARGAKMTAIPTTRDAPAPVVADTMCTANDTPSGTPRYWSPSPEFLRLSSSSTALEL